MNTLFLNSKENKFYNCVDELIIKKLSNQYIKIIDFDYKMSTLIIQFTENKDEKKEYKIFGYSVYVEFQADDINIFSLLVYINGEPLFNISLLANEFDSDYSTCSGYIIDSCNGDFDLSLGIGILPVDLFPNIQGAINYIVAKYKIFELEKNL